MTKKPNFQPGDTIAFSARFLKDTGQFTGPSGAMRGVFVSYDPGMGERYSRVRWGDEEARIAGGEGDYAEADYCDIVRRLGSLVCTANICKVGSARFACNDI